MQTEGDPTLIVPVTVMVEVDYLLRARLGDDAATLDHAHLRIVQGPGWELVPAERDL